MRHEASFRNDIISACRRIEAIVTATSEESFLKDEVLPAAVLHHYAIVWDMHSKGNGTIAL
jgi:uncharacterized protein with HEPN domain